jgi:hypothetical protein
MAQNDQALLTRLKASRLEFVVIGGVCVVYHGAPLATFDLDLCCPFGDENVRRIEAALADLHPVHRLTPEGLPLAATRSSFRELKNLYLQTDLIWANSTASGKCRELGLSRPCSAKASWRTFRAGRFGF